MAIDTKTPLALYKANLELVLRLGTLLQENRKRWNAIGSSGTADAVERTLAETERMLTTNDWKSLATIPGEGFWKSIQESSGPLQGTAEAAMANQAAFAEGLREAFTAWQQQSVDALGEAMLPIGKFDMTGFISLFQGLQPVAATQAQARSAPKPNPKAATAPARKKAPKAPVKKKPAPKKPAAAKKGSARKAAKSAKKRS